jgi:Domain of unknown function (DUF4440)
MTHEGPVAEIVGCETERRRAILERDWEALRALLADELVHVHARGGRVDDKHSYLSQVQRLKVLSMKRDDMAVRFYGIIAISVGRLTNTFANDDGTVTTLNAICTQVWDCSSGVWQLCSFQATAVD